MSHSVLPGHRFWNGLLALTCLAQETPPADAVLRSLLATDPQSFLRRLEAQRAPAIAPESKELILQALPLEGRITALGRSTRRKLDSLQPVLALHQRDSVYEVMVIDVPQAFTGLHARAVVLISELALELLEVPELQAVVAHEIAHDYVWEEYHQARDRQDSRRLQELELHCDGIAVLTMLRLGLDPLRLITGLEKIIRANRQRLGWARNEDRYPPIADRRRFAQAVVAWAQPSR